MYSQQLQRETVVSIINIIGELNQLQDVDMILSSTLYEARALARADAGSIFLMRNGGLEFRHVQNDTIFGVKGAGFFQYSDEVLPVSDRSIVGYAALTKEMVAIDDAYAIAPGLPYQFNASFDEKNSYRTVSILAVPLISRNHSLVGVMQLINAKDRQGRVVSFSEQCKTLVPIFTNNAAAIIERGILNRELVLRMAKMAELHDPEETGAHVQRVSAFSAEIYQHWAESRQVPRWEIRRFRDIISQASMLHDAGKVGIPDAVLKKPGPLNDKEFALVKQHTVYGAKLFTSISSELDQVTHDIMLHHHERWNGTGYPDQLAGSQIPLAARITALADVFDALSSQRCYKRAWAAAAIHEEIQAKSGQDFDPELVDVFFEITDILHAIQQKFA
ncbi:MAG: GAF and HD-GYP domain-containing protein [Candidatus Electronema sp. V4]|uniref:GAF and HD-GYP domain-containing protein n=1 Tax=Candidatus Electronema sp. V4 TaxID=3454756 RepID=UPI0040556A59